jgi:hypothetical protein
MRLTPTDNRPTGQTVQWREWQGNNLITCAGYVVGHTPEGYLVERYDDGTTEHVKHREVMPCTTK